MKVQLDDAKCQGHGRCYDLAPQVFDEDDEGYARLVDGGVVPPDAERSAVLAVKNCPENALSVLQEARA